MTAWLTALGVDTSNLGRGMCFGAGSYIYQRPYQPFFRIIYGDFCRGGEAFPVALRAVKDFRKLGVHVLIEYGEKNRNGKPLVHAVTGNARKNLLWKEVAETREKMEEVLQDFLSELWAKHEQTLNLMDDEFFDKSFYKKINQRI